MKEQKNNTRETQNVRIKIISFPTEAELRPTEEQKNFLRNLYLWEQNSRKTIQICN